jgi:hypothetical protein
VGHVVTEDRRCSDDPRRKLYPRHYPCLLVSRTT